MTNTSSWSSLECSPPCQGGGRRFKSDRGRLQQHGTVRKPEKRRSSNLRDRLWVRFPPVLLKQHASAGHRRASVVVTHPSSGCGGSTPSRRTDNLALARCDDGFAARLSILPARVRFPSASLENESDTAKWRNQQTRDAQNVVPRAGVGVQLSPWLLDVNRLQVGRRPVGFHTPDLPGSIPGPATRRGWASAHSGLISLNCRVRPRIRYFDMTRYANRQSEQAENL